MVDYHYIWLVLLICMVGKMRRLTSTTFPALRLWSPGMAAWQCLRRGQRNRCFGRLLWRLGESMDWSPAFRHGFHSPSLYQKYCVIDEGILGDQHRTSIMDNNGICMNSKLIILNWFRENPKSTHQYTTVSTLEFRSMEFLKKKSHQKFWEIPWSARPKWRMFLRMSLRRDWMTHPNLQRLDVVQLEGWYTLIYRTWSVKLLVADLLDAIGCSFLISDRILCCENSALEPARAAWSSWRFPSQRLTCLPGDQGQCYSTNCSWLSQTGTDQMRTTGSKRYLFPRFIQCLIAWTQHQVVSRCIFSTLKYNHLHPYVNRQSLSTKPLSTQAFHPEGPGACGQPTILLLPGPVRGRVWAKGQSIFSPQFPNKSNLNTSPAFSSHVIHVHRGSHVESIPC